MTCLPVPCSLLRLCFQEPLIAGDSYLCAISCVPTTLGFSLAVFCRPCVIRFNFEMLMLTDRIWEQWDNDSLIDLTVSSHWTSLCVPVGDFSRQLTSMWRRAALHEWWPMRIYQSSLYQVSHSSFIILEYSCMWGSNSYNFMSQCT